MTDPGSQGAPVRVALLGCGVVGSAVARQLVDQADELAARAGARLELVGIAVRRAGRRREPGIDPALLTTDAEGLVERADVVVYDPAARTRISVETHHMNLDYSAYEGWTVDGGVRTVISRGRTVVDRGTYTGRTGHGRFVPRGLSTYLR